MGETHEYVYEVIDNGTDARTCAQLIAEEFSLHEPICVFSHTTLEYFFEEVSYPLIKKKYLTNNCHFLHDTVLQAKSLLPFLLAIFIKHD
jgi:hypothetical protein